MSHQTGISSGKELKDVFCESTTAGNIRCIQIAIENETLVCSTCVNKTSDSWEKEFDDAVQSLLKDKQPCYILYQMESKDKWVLLTYSPDDSPVRQKMMYAATRASLKSDFGGSFIVDEVFGNSKKELTYDGYLKHVTHKDAPPPLTNSEEELKILEESESKSGIGNSTRHQTVQGIEFPITDGAQNAIREFKEGAVTHVELNVDTSKEEIFKVTSQNIGASDLESAISKDRAGYHIFKYSHRHNGEQIDSTIFVYSMPGYSIPIKERMLYSSCKAPLLSGLEDVFQIKFDRKLEIDKDELVNEEYIRNQIHPPEVDVKRGFAKPKGPGRRNPTKRPR